MLILIALLLLEGGDKPVTALAGIPAHEVVMR